MSKLRLRAPSPAMIVALIALVLAAGGSAIAATALVSGDKIIKRGSLSGTGCAHTLRRAGQPQEARQVPSAAGCPKAIPLDDLVAAHERGGRDRRSTGGKDRAIRATIIADSAREGEAWTLWLS